MLRPTPPAWNETVPGDVVFSWESEWGREMTSRDAEPNMTSLDCVPGGKGESEDWLSLPPEWCVLESLFLYWEWVLDGLGEYPLEELVSVGSKSRSS
jgi:hypothetical protein